MGSVVGDPWCSKHFSFAFFWSPTFSQKQDSATLDMERANKEIEVLRKQYEAMSQELKEATQEAEVAKCRRDWAFQERDKIVAERESIRCVCARACVRVCSFLPPCILP